AAVSHEHVVPVFAVEEHLGLPYLVMEYIPGTSLEHYLRRHGPLDALAVVRVGLQVAQALAAAHAQGLVHRDIKPANILLDRGVDRIKVGDFGLARVPHEVNCTQSDTVAGTPQFMAPEQVRGETCSPPVDLFGLGALMYAMCTGTSPFRAETVFGVMQRVLERTPKSLREENPEVPAWLEQFIFRLLEKDPQDRFASAEEVARLLEKELAYLQNPTTAEKPDRSWVPHGPTSPRARGFASIARSWLLVPLLTASLMAVGWVFWPSAVENNLQDSIGGRTPVPAGSAPAHWDADGTSELAERVRQLGEQMQFTCQAPPTPDPWNQKVGEVRRRLSSLKESDP
ncbi:MAG: serine/threonine-protein kinase, partial [Planctomycetota bacterium]